MGLAANDATVDLPTTGITRSEISITGSIFGSACIRRDFRDYAQHYLDGALPIDQLIGRRYRLEDINEAVSDMLAGAPGRGVIRFDRCAA